MKLFYLSLFFILICFTNSIFGQNDFENKVKKIELIKNDTTKINLYIELLDEIKENHPINALAISKEVNALSLKSNHKRHVVLNILTRVYYLNNKFEEAQNFAFKTINISKRLERNLGFDYEGRACENLSNIYQSLENYDLAIKYQSRALRNYLKLKNDNYYALAYLNLAIAYGEGGYVDKAKYYYLKSERGLKETSQELYLPYVYNGLGTIVKDRKEALNFYNKAKEVILKYNKEDKSALAMVYNNIGNIQNELGNYGSAIVNFSEALKIFQKLEDKRSIADVIFNLSIANHKLGQFKEASNYMMEYEVLRDSILNQDTRQTLHDLSIKYETEKKEQTNKILQKDNEKKQISIYFALAAIILIFLILIIIFRNNRIKAKINKKLAAQNEIIEKQNKIVEEQKAIVEEQNRDITDSIKYAERIQGAILPPEQKWQQILPNSFVLNKPKDILSGDFYWIADTETHVFVAAADCTGHGVPGALISIVNYNLLNKAVLERGLRSPNEILDAVNAWLTESLHQSIEESSIRDGMDVSLISINKKNGQILFSGANNPLYLFINNELQEFKADKFPVGAYINEEIQKFSVKEIDAKFGDTIYLFSDGFADQFGGPFGKKYKYKQFKEKLFIAKDLPIHEQKVYLEREFKSWKGNLEQTDDILIVGINII